MVQPSDQPTVMQWVNKLEAKIAEQVVYAKPYELRYANDYVLPFVAQEYREVYGQQADAVLVSIMEAPRGGSAAIGIDALVERLTVLGGTSDDAETNRALTEAWEDNDLDVMHREAHREAMVRRTSFGAVSRATDGRAIGTIESSEQAAVHRQQAPPYDVDAYLKVWTDEWSGKRRGLLQLADYDYNLVEGMTVESDPDGSAASSRWAVEGEPVRRAGPVPVVEFAHRPRLLKLPQSEIEPIRTLVDLDDLISALMVFAGHFGAVPIRWATGLDIPRDPNDPAKPLLGPDGKPVMGFKARADHFWFNSNKDAQFGQMVPASLDTYVTWATWVRSQLRANTKVASMYYAFDLKSHMTGELLKVDEAPMVRRVKAMGSQGTFNQAWRRFLTLMMQVEGKTGRVKPTWEDPQTRMEAPAVDAFGKAVAAGLGVQTAAEQFLGWDPDLAEKAVVEAEAALALSDEGTIGRLLRPPAV